MTIPPPREMAPGLYAGMAGDGPDLPLRGPLPPTTDETEP